MSSDGMVVVQKGNQEVNFYGEHQYTLPIGVAISLARHLYTERPESYKALFKKPADFEHDGFEVCEDEDVFGDCTAYIDLKKELVTFYWTAFEAAMTDEWISTAKEWLFKLKPFCKAGISDDPEDKVETMEDLSDLLVLYKFSRFELSNDKSSKFWQIAKVKTDLMIIYGRIDNDGKLIVKKFPDHETANSEQKRLIRQKMAKGYLKAGTDLYPCHYPEDVEFEIPFENLELFEGL